MKPSFAKIRSNHHFLFTLSLGVTIIISVLLVASNNVDAKTIESIIRYEKFLGEGPQIKVGDTKKEFEMDIQVNIDTNKIYVANPLSNTVSVIDSDSGTTKNIRVGEGPLSIAISMDKIYVANTDFLRTGLE